MNIKNNLKVTSKNKMNKKGVSPIIATVLLVAMVLVIAIIVFFWLRGFLKEPITKFGDENVELACDKVVLTGKLDDSQTNLEISNNGNVPIEEVKLKLVDAGGNYDSYTAGSRLKAGKTLRQINEKDLTKKDETSAKIVFENYKKIVIIPVLLGKTSSGEEKKYVCPDRNGKEVYITQK